MKYKITAVNTNNNEVIEFELEKIDDKLAYYDANLEKYVHPQEVADNVIREVNNNLVLVNSPIHAMEVGEEAEFNQSMTFNISIVCEE